MLHLTIAQTACVIAAGIFNCGLAAAAFGVVLNDRPQLRLLALKGQVIAARRAPPSILTRTCPPQATPMCAAPRRAHR
jgi:hypothetical protein